MFPLNEHVVIRRYVYKDEPQIPIEGLVFMYLNQPDGGKYLLEFTDDVGTDEIDVYTDRLGRLLFEAIQGTPPSAKEDYDMLIENCNYYVDVLAAQKENYPKPLAHEESKEQSSHSSSPIRPGRPGLSLAMEPELKALPFQTLFQGPGSLYMIDQRTDEQRLA